jgi:hypothetical protein
MKIWVVIETVDEPYYGGTSAKLEARAYPDEDEAQKSYGTYCFEVDHKDAFRMFPGLVAPFYEKRGKTAEYKTKMQEFTDWFNSLAHYYSARGQATGALKGLKMAKTRPLISGNDGKTRRRL